MVAPRAGAWIETTERHLVVGKAALSLPVRERGLKLISVDDSELPKIVAPRAGAWIETRSIWCARPPCCCRSPCGSVD